MLIIDHTTQAHLDELDHLDEDGIRARHDELEDMARRHALDFDLRDPDMSGLRWDFTGHMDAAESSFIARQLEFIREELFYVLYPTLKSRFAMPWNTEIDPGVEQFTARAVDLSGDVQVNKDQSDDIPMVELKVTSATGDLFGFAFGYAYSDDEARKAIYARMPLPSMKAKACREIMARKLDDIAWLGESKTKILGLATLPTSGGTSVTVYTPIATDPSGTAVWENKPVDDVLKDLNGLGNLISVNTNETSEPDTWVLPNSAYEYINSRRVGDGSTRTILKTFTKNNDMVKVVVRTQKLEATRNIGGVSTNAPWGASRRMLAYKNDKSRFELLVPMEFLQKMPQINGFKVKTFCEMRTGGIATYVPQSIGYATTF
jgi:hypothetical protein